MPVTLICLLRSRVRSFVRASVRPSLRSSARRSVFGLFSRAVRGGVPPQAHRSVRGGRGSLALGGSRCFVGSVSRGRWFSHRFVRPKRRNEGGQQERENDVEIGRERERKRERGRKDSAFEPSSASKQQRGLAARRRPPPPPGHPPASRELIVPLPLRHAPFDFCCCCLLLMYLATRLQVGNDRQGIVPETYVRARPHEGSRH